MPMGRLSPMLRGMDTRYVPDDAAPLSGIRVLDLSRLLPGPYCSLLLAQLGAEVIKVETPLAGDYARMAPAEAGFGGIFESLNRGKRSIAIDYRKPRGRDLLLKLVETADVFLESSRPGRLDRCGLGALALRSINPALVYCSISGYGQTGPHRDKPGHDIDYLAVSGVLALLGPAGQPVPPGLQLADVSTGAFAAVRDPRGAGGPRGYRPRRLPRRGHHRQRPLLAGYARAWHRPGRHLPRADERRLSLLRDLPFCR